MSLLTICQEALEEIGEFNVPATIVGNTDPTAVQLLALANREVRVLRRRSGAHGWQALRIELSQTTTTDTILLVALPADWDKFLNATWWDSTNRWPLRGPATPAIWQNLQIGIANAAPRRWFRIYADGIQLWPTPGNSTDVIKIEYQSKYVIDTAGDGTGASVKWVLDADESLLDEELIAMGLNWRFLKAKGLPYGEERNEYNAEVSKALAVDKSAAVLHLSYRPQTILIGPDSVPDTGYGA